MNRYRYSPANLARGAAMAVIAMLLCPATGAAADQQLNENRERWSGAGISSYSYGYRKFCECNPETPPETQVTVNSGVVTDVRHRPHGADFDVLAEEKNFDLYYTVEELFGLVSSGYARGATVRVSYHETLGYPVQIFIDYGPDSFRDPLDLRLTRLEADRG